jgi:hypothetical protein
MADDRRAMYDGFSKKSGHLVEWVRIVKEFLNQAFAGFRRVAKCPCTICQNYRFLNHDEVQVHLCQEGFMPNYLVWRDHGEVEPSLVGTESDGNEDDDRMDEMLAFCRLALGDGVSDVLSYSQKSNVTSSSAGSQSSQAQMSEELWQTKELVQQLPQSNHAVVVGQNPQMGVDRQHESREARSLYLSALQLARALRLRFVGRAT